MKPAALSTAEFRRAMGQFATGVTVVTVPMEGSGSRAVRGMTANSFTSVSLKPLLVLICVDDSAKILSSLHHSKRFGVSVLTAEQQALSEYFASGKPSLERESRLGIRYHWTESGIPLIDGTLAQLACHVKASHKAGDHTIFVGDVESVGIHPGEPLLFFRGQYRQLPREG